MKNRKKASHGRPMVAYHTIRKYKKRLSINMTTKWLLYLRILWLEQSIVVSHHVVDDAVRHDTEDVVLLTHLHPETTKKQGRPETREGVMMQLITNERRKVGGGLSHRILARHSRKKTPRWRERCWRL